ncbi:Nn.00g093570.m01.CDS01 [Neocucurbitaria sp. VM-36]
MAVGSERRAKKTASRLDHTLLLEPVGSAMTFNPGVGAPVPDTTSTPSPADRPGFNSTLAGQESIAQPQQQSSKKRRPSKSKVPGELRRSTSTPHMRNLALGASGELSPTSNKARNKLGYHRTSVACGHCRRRKIRCLLAPDDPQSRCANCIRLKKECNFYPVEHNPEMQRSQAAGSKDTSPGQPATPGTSSPRHLPSGSGDNVGEFRTPFAGTSAAQPSNYGYPGETELDPQQTPVSGRMPVQQPSYPYPHPIETQWPPTNTFLPSSTVGESPSSNASYWRQSPSTANSAYGSESNVSGGHTPAAMSTSSTMSYGHQDSPWGHQPPFQPPTRSMSYGNIEGLPQQYPGQGLGIHHDFPRRTSPYPYPTSIDTNPATVHATTLGGSTSAPLSAPIIPNHQYYPPTWSPYDAAPNQGPPVPMPGRSMSAQWYTESGHLDRVQEEGAPPMAYNHGMQQFYSGA